MIETNELRKIGYARLKDAEFLYQNKRYDGSLYLCGYAIEMMLKARICSILKWQGYPSTRSEFQNYRSFRTHNPDVLLHLSGSEVKIKREYFTDWSVIATWDTEVRYEKIGNASDEDAFNMIGSRKKLMDII